MTSEQITAARRGERVALEAVAERALRVSLRTAVALLGDREAAADVAQEVALRAVTQLASLRSPTAFDAWVHRAAIRECVRARRRHGREVPLERAPELVATHLDPDLRLSLAERLAALPTRQRSAVVLRYVHDLSDADIATVLGCRVGTVHALLSRARADLREDPATRGLAFAEVGGAR